MSLISPDNLMLLQVSRFGHVETYLASQEVVLSAGSIGSPQILMLSGVGDRDHLDQVGVTPLHHLPAVGQNLQDHLITSLIFDTEQPLSIDLLGSSSPSAVLQYLSGKNVPACPLSLIQLCLAGEGPMTSSGACGGLAFIHTELSTRQTTTLQGSITPAPLSLSLPFS